MLCMIITWEHQVLQHCSVFTWKAGRRGRKKGGGSEVLGVGVCSSKSLHRYRGTSHFNHFFPLSLSYSKLFMTAIWLKGMSEVSILWLCEEVWGTITTTLISRNCRVKHKNHQRKRIPYFCWFMYAASLYTHVEHSSSRGGYSFVKITLQLLFRVYRFSAFC